MKRLSSLITILVCGFVLFACATNTVRTNYDFDGSANFDLFETFAWISGDRLYIADNLQGQVSPLLEERLASIVDAELEAKGLRSVSNVDSADIAVVMTVGARDRVQVDTYPSATLFYDPLYGGYRIGPPGMERLTTQYVEGSLSIDFFDTRLSKPVWHGQGTRNLGQNISPLTDDELHAAVSEILSGYPPQ